MKKQIFLLTFFMYSFSSNAQTVITLAGSDGGFSDGLVGVPAQFGDPVGIATDASGNVYVSDVLYDRIRKISPSGIVSTLAGSTSGYLDGPCADAKFSRPTGVAIDESGNVYVADSYNHKIRKITPTGVVSTLAGSSLGYLDGTGTLAKFYNPLGLTVDLNGNVYVADSANNRIRKISPTGVVTTLAGSTQGYNDGIGATAKFYGPSSVVTDTSGNVYVADSGNNKIRKITPSGVVTTLAGSTSGYVDGAGTSAKFSSPNGISIDNSGNIYVTDYYNAKIRKITPSGYVTTFAGSTGYCGTADGSGISAQFCFPSGVATDTSGNLYIADTNNHKIRKINPAGFVTSFAGYSLSGNVDGIGNVTKFAQPEGVAADVSGNIYIADTYNHKIRKISPSGIVSTFAGSTNGSSDGIGTAAQFSSPKGVATDASGNVYVADYGNNKIRKITPSGVVSTFAGTFIGSVDGIGTAAEFSYPTGVATDVSGNVYVADYGNNKIRKITPSGVVTTIAGSFGYVSGYVDGFGSEARFNGPYGIATDTSGNLYVADSANNRIRKITQSSIVTTLASATQGIFSSPKGVVTDVKGNVYVADWGNSLIRKITPIDEVYTLAGSGIGYADGIGTSAQFWQPCGIAIDINSNFYIADTNNNKIRKITQASLGLNQFKLQNSTMKLYPIPTHNILNIDIDSFSTLAQIKISDIMGKIVYSQKIEDKKTLVPISIYNKGIYFVTLTDGNKIETRKFIID